MTDDSNYEEAHLCEILANENSLNFISCYHILPHDIVVGSYIIIYNAFIY